jgi:deaminated glutathione amidase
VHAGKSGRVGAVSGFRLALVQQTASLDPAENREMFTAVAGKVEPDTDLVLVPEAFMRDFGPPGQDIAPFAEPMDGPFVRRLTEFAAECGSTVVAGMFEVSDDPARPFNTLAVVDAGGLRASYRKIHLYDSFGYKESDRLSAGEIEPVLVDVGEVTVGLMTCYDLRFPELARELVKRGAELLVAPSAWVAGPAKVHHWRTLAIARAIENVVYVAAVGQPGPRYTGHSLVVGPAGDLVAELGDGDHVLTASIDLEGLERARADNPSLLNRRF